MKPDIHPAYHELNVIMTDGTAYKTRTSGGKPGATLRLDYQKLGYGVSAFLGIYLQKSSEYTAVVNQLREIPEVVNINFTTGAYGVFARLQCRDTQHLRDVLHDRIQPIEGILRTETLISLEEVLNRSADLT